MRTIKRAFLILQILASEAKKLSLMEIAEKSRLNKATCLRFLRSLEEIELVRKDSRTGLYELGPKVVFLSNGFLKSLRIEEKVGPYLERLVSETEETAFYAIRKGDSRVTLYLVGSPHATRTLIDVGIPVPLTSGCAGRAILAFLPQEEIDRILSKARTPRLTPWSIVKPDQIRKKIVEARARGYAVGIRERTPTTNAVAAPVFDSQGVIATLAIVAPAERLTRKACEQMGPIVRDLALRLSEEMGFQALGRSFRLLSRQTAGT